MLSTPWSRRMGLRVPIVNAPMGGVAGGRLAAGVTAAGGLGMVGMGTAGSTSALHAELPHVRGMFGIGLVEAQVIDRLCEGAEKLLTNWERET